MKLLDNFVLTIIFFLIVSTVCFGQSKLKPGFDPVEYREALETTARQADTTTALWNELKVPFPENCRLEYRSDTVGLSNRWDLWIRDDSVGIINIRGTVPAADSWAEDFYAAMVPAKGSIIIDSKNVFIYKLAESSKAAVHAGWLTALAYLSPTVIDKINEYYTKGIKDFIITGHSQGGAIAYLLTSYIHYLDEKRIPSDIKFKTYCSAPPKPGNLFYSYDFDYITRDGWALRVYNSEDWVPQTPISVQTFSDFSKINPYKERDSLTAKMDFIEKIIFDYLENRLKDKLQDASDLLNEYFGKMVYDKSIKKYLPEFPAPQYSNDSYYYPCGVPVVLMATADYQNVIEKENGIPLLFKNHLILPYYFLLNKIYFGR